jgi:hypothetical protein
MLARVSKNWSKRQLIVALFGLLIAACSEVIPATSIVVVVRADSESLVTQLAAVTVQLYPVGATHETEAVEDRTFSLSQGGPVDGTYALPFSFSIDKGKAERFLLVVSGYRVGDPSPVIEQKVIASFRDRETVSVNIVLSLACYQRTCAGLDETCQPDASSNTKAASCGAVKQAEAARIIPGTEFDAAAPPPGTDAGEGSTMDSGGPDGSDATLDATEGGGEAGGSPPDAGPDAGSWTAAIASSGAPCSQPSAKACDAHNGTQKLVCFNGQWAPNGSCDGETRCQTQLDSPSVGSCQPVVAACLGKLPGVAVCDSSARRTCGPDLLDLESQPCPAHASCQDQGGDAMCRCDDPYFGDGAGGCTTPVCIQMPCEHGGICSIDGAGRSCDCSATDYTGASCETQIDDCALNPCANGGQCRDGVRSRSCDCGAVDFAGSNCETPIDDCALNPCANGGQCTDGVRSRSCNCGASDYTGASCEIQIDDCALTPCPHGTCIDGVRARSCDCTDSGFSGPLCQTNINECAGPNVCSGSLLVNVFSFPCQDYTGDVAGYTCKGQFPDWPTPPTGAGRFSASAGVVSDNHTGLQWQQSLDATGYTSADAKTYCTANPLSGGGWRLPTLAELLSIVDYRLENPAIDTTAFPGTPSEYFYTSDPYIETNNLPSLMWSVTFSNGISTFGNATRANRVRCVR